MSWEGTKGQGVPGFRFVERVSLQNSPEPVLNEDH